MSWALFNMEGFLFLLRWGHFLFGISWIGTLWYFNFAQGPFMNEVDAPVKSAVNAKLAPRTLWYFRWGAMGTLITGWLIILLRVSQGISLSSSWGATILTGALFGTLMWFNVWFIIWPNQQMIVAAAQGGPAVENAAAVARRAFLASRTNTLLSIPLLFLMGAASHLPISVDPSKVGLWIGLIVVFLVLAEINALKADKGPTIQPIEKVKGVIQSGLVLTAILYVLMEVIL
ncbi:MAG TPA: hypothetical protein DCQ83_07670 [Fibrobacteres bacterium]|nr:hypothetical protein [Fibrobacterota bacterium]